MKFIQGYNMKLSISILLLLTSVILSANAENLTNEVDAIEKHAIHLQEKTKQRANKIYEKAQKTVATTQKTNDYRKFFDGLYETEDFVNDLGLTLKDVMTVRQVEMATMYLTMLEKQ